MIQEFTSTSVDDSNDIQLINGSGVNGSSREGMERIQNYGLSSNPPSDAPSVGVNIGGNVDRYVIIAMDGGQYRVKALKEGEVCLYDKNGSKIYLKEDGSINIDGSQGASIVLNGNLEVLA
jgi:phage gp45-like